MAATTHACLDRFRLLLLPSKVVEPAARKQTRLPSRVKRMEQSIGDHGIPKKMKTKNERKRNPGRKNEHYAHAGLYHRRGTAQILVAPSLEVCATMEHSNGNKNTKRKSALL